MLISELVDDSPHKWAAVVATCDLQRSDDPIVDATAQAVRDAYGENVVIESLLQDPKLSTLFDTAPLVAAIRKGLPDPTKESKKPKQLTNYRSESTEMVARAALAMAYSIEFATHPQMGKPNPNQPILGFDGWGILSVDVAEAHFVLVQVKGTEDEACPPGEADALASECQRAPKDIAAICRALTILATRLEGTLLHIVLTMLTKLGHDELPSLVVAPVIVRGVKGSSVADLQPIRDVMPTISPAIGRGLSISIGAKLTDFGSAVMQKARGT